MDKKLLRYAALFLFPLYALYSIGLYVFNAILLSDIVLSGTLLSDLVYQLYIWAEPAVFAVLIALLLFGLGRYGQESLLPLYLLSGGALVFAYLAKIIADSFLSGALDLTANYLVIFLIPLLIDLLLAAFSVLFTKARLARANAEPESDAAKAPIRFLDFKSPLQCGVLFTALLTGGVRLINLLVGLFSIGFDPADIPFYLLNLAMDILLPILFFYLLGVATLRFLSKKISD